MNEDLKKKYLEFREKGWMAREALSAARTMLKVQPFLDRGLVRLRVEPEEENYWDVYGTDGETEKNIKFVNELIERNGLWWACTEARLTKNHSWELCDSVGMLIGTDNYLDCSEPDLWASALAVLDKLFQNDADEIAKKGTYAAGVAVYMNDNDLVAPYTLSHTTYLPPPMKRNDPTLLNLVDNRTRSFPWVPHRRTRKFYSPKIRKAWKDGEDPTEWRARL